MKLFLNKKEKKIVLVSIIGVGLLLSGLILWYKKTSKIVEDADTVEQQTPLPPKFSRITFFHASKPICTLAIPENWEGKYRLQDSGGVAKFLYIKEADNPELFYFKKYKKNEKINSETERKVFENKSSVYVVSLSTQNVDKFVNKNEFVKMTKDFDEVLKSFKCF